MAASSEQHTAGLAAVDYDSVRAHFPGLASDAALLDNAGGSQMPAIVIDAMTRYMRHSFVQTGADYAESRHATETCADAHHIIKTLLNADDKTSSRIGAGEVVLGPSSSLLLHQLADAYADALEPSASEIIVSQSCHEANIGGWVRLQDRGFTVKGWLVDPSTGESPVDRLRELLTDRTKLVVFGQVSNLLGGITDVAEVTRLAHEAGAKVVVDGVAFAPHRAPDVAAWGVDWYAVSLYKVYGPHIAALFGTHHSLGELTGPNHFFVPREKLPQKFELGGVNHEACAGLTALPDYLRVLAGQGADESFDRSTVTRAYETMTALELPLQARLLGWLRDHPRVRLIGPATDGPERVSTISFVHDALTSQEIAQTLNAQRLGVRYGHFYSYRQCRAMGITPEDGVVRVSLVHYNTPAEVERLIEALGVLM